MWTDGVAKTRVGDYDSENIKAHEEELGHRLPFGLTGITSGIRPPNIRKRLKWVGLDVTMLRMVKADNYLATLTPPSQPSISPITPC
jgi:hypothetical protein